MIWFSWIITYFKNVTNPGSLGDVRRFLKADPERVWFKIKEFKLDSNQYSVKSTLKENMSESSDKIKNNSTSTEKDRAQSFETEEGSTNSQNTDESKEGSKVIVVYSRIASRETWTQ